MECLKVLDDVEKIAESLKIPFFKHFANIAVQSNKLRNSINKHIHIRDVEVAEFRTTYQYLCDWLYGWNVVLSDTYGAGGAGISSRANLARGNSALGSSNLGTAAAGDGQYSVAKSPRKMVLEDEGERAEMEKLVKSFETLADNYEDMLNRWNEEVAAWITSGSFVCDGKADEEDGASAAASVVNYELTPAASLAGQALGHSGSFISSSSSSSFHRKKTASSQPISGAGAAGPSTSKRSTTPSLNSEDGIDDYHIIGRGEKARAAKTPTQPPPTNSTTAQQQQSKHKNNNASRISEEGDESQPDNVIQEEEEEEEGEQGKESDEKQQGNEDDLPIIKVEELKGGDEVGYEETEIARVGSESNEDGSAGEDEDGNEDIQGLLGDQAIDENPLSDEDETKGSADKKTAPESPKDKNAGVKTADQMYQFIDAIVDYTILRVLCSLITMGLAEALKNHELYAVTLQKLLQVTANFTNITFKAFHTVLAKDFEQDPLTSIEIRDPIIFRNWIKKYAMIFEANVSAFNKGSMAVSSAVLGSGLSGSVAIGSGSGSQSVVAGSMYASNNLMLVTPVQAEAPVYPFGKKPTIGHRKVPRTYQKFQYLSRLVSTIDVFLFPVSMLAHKRGVKCLQYSYLNSIFWVTGGYDGTVKIYDISNQTCLAQFVGHKSIVTDLKVTKKDTHVISVSFDRTVKIWNIQTAYCEKTLIGHSDAITSCDLSPDHHYVATSSLDMTARIWDIKTGQCVAIVKKHTKWIKMVRFSPDGLHLATASLDHKVYLWDLKIVLHSKNMTYTRCIDAHQDSILCIAMHKPNLLLTASRDHHVKLFDYMTGSEIHSVSLTPSWACTVAFSLDGQLFAAGCFDSTIHIFRTKNGEKIRQLKLFNLGILSIAFPEHDQYILCGTSDGFIQQIPL